MGKVKRRKMIKIVNFSGGKDSTAMLHLMLEKGEQIDHVVFFQTDWEFPIIENHIERVEQNTGFHIERIRNYRPFNELIRLYGWPHSSGGWCTACKRDNLDKYMRAVKTDVCCLGFALDEKERIEKDELNKKRFKLRFPLIETNLTQKDSLEYCYELGYDWDGLYKYFPRVSCFCCPKAEKSRRSVIRHYFPELEEKWKHLDSIAKRKSIPMALMFQD